MNWKFSALTVALMLVPANSVVAQDYGTQVNVETAPAAVVQPAVDVNQYLGAIATKFGVSVDRLQKLIAKLPPRGEGLSGIEVSVIAGKLGLDKSGKEMLKAKVGKGGSGLSATDVSMIGASLGLDTTQVAFLSSQLGLPTPSTTTTNAVVNPMPVNVPASTTTTGGAVVVPTDPTTDGPVVAPVPSL